MYYKDTTEQYLHMARQAQEKLILWLESIRVSQLHNSTFKKEV